MSIDDKHPTQYFGPGAKVTFRGPHGTPITVDLDTWNDLIDRGRVTPADIIQPGHVGACLELPDDECICGHLVGMCFQPDTCPIHRTDVTRAELRDVFASRDAAHENARAWRRFALALALVLAAAILVGVLR